MNRQLTHLSAAICFAAGTVAPASAAPSVEQTPVDMNAVALTSPSERSRAHPSITADELIRASFEHGFALFESSPPTANGSGRIYKNDQAFVSNTPLTSDASEFISPQWLSNDTAVAAFSTVVLEGETPPAARLSMFASSDAQTLSVPEIPLPMGVIPGLIGVGLAAVAHRRSIRRRKMVR